MEEDKKIRRGICHNHGLCDKANNKEIQEIPEDQTFECKECHSDLKEVDINGKLIDDKKTRINPKKRNKFIAIVIGVVVIGLIIAAIIVFAPHNENTEEGLQPETTGNIVQEEPEEQTDSIVEPLEEIPEIKEGAKSAVAPQSAPPVSSLHKLSYGTWSGGWKNGQPNGNGTMTYTEEHLIDSRDSKGRVAKPGEYIIGEWDHGHLVQGRWFKNDGSKEAVIIGKAG